jgi:hypothetical protein
MKKPVAIIARKWEDNKETKHNFSGARKKYEKDETFFPAVSS